ncbi:uncharacterized protein LOC125228853 [Leguminivora glycinivorella]|uniref:uncharacterized protein LOC125228853 n=1 Tax=Leguminivora glycinivorella TaxID=1035111 RepID=UPI002010023E|nr:uncharacterized protein LOC125228853 [Leguminivora glycinivorella]
MKYFLINLLLLTHNPVEKSEHGRVDACCVNFTKITKMYDTNSGFKSMDVASGVSESATSRLPERSRKAYDKIYQDFMNWKISNDIESFKEDVILSYFSEMSDKFKYSTLATNFSILKNTLVLNHKVDISKYSKVIALLKSKAEGYTGKKSKTFSPDDINKFIKEAHDDEYLAAKVALIFGIVGACRRQELHRLRFTDVEVYEARIFVKIYNAKSNTYRVFTITGEYFELVKKYISLRPDHCHTPSFFIHYQTGKYTSMSVGINQFGNLGKTIAKYLGLPNPELYTGHCFRRTSATILVDADGDILPLRGQARYKTIPVSEPEDSTSDSMSSLVANKSIVDKNGPSKPENCSSDITELRNDESHHFPTSFENQSIEHVNINISNTDDVENSMDNKDEVWSQIQNCFFKKKTDTSVNTPGTSLSEDYFDDLMEDEDKVKNPTENPLEDNGNKIVNISVPGTPGNLKQILSTLVRFNNCNIQNINIYCNK